MDLSKVFKIFLTLESIVRRKKEKFSGYVQILAARIRFCQKRHSKTLVSNYSQFMSSEGLNLGEIRPNRGDLIKSVVEYFRADQNRTDPQSRIELIHIVGQNQYQKQDRTGTQSMKEQVPSVEQNRDLEQNRTGTQSRI